MKINEIENKIKEINPEWSINYSENIDYSDPYAQGARHSVEITVNRIFNGDTMKILKAKNDEFNCLYIKFNKPYATGADVEKLLKLVQLLKDYLNNFKGYRD